MGGVGGGLADDGTLEIGYAIVTSSWGRGYATDAVRALVSVRGRCREPSGWSRTPLDRPQSARVVEKAGFALAGEMTEEHESASIRVQRWELEL